MSESPGLSRSAHHVPVERDPDLPRTVKAVDTIGLLALEITAEELGHSQRLPVDWVAAHAAHDGIHYLWPELVHHTHDPCEALTGPGTPRDAVQWRCTLLLTVATGEEVVSLLDVRPSTFTALPETLDPAGKTAALGRMRTAPSQADWEQRRRVGGWEA